MIAFSGLACDRRPRDVLHDERQYDDERERIQGRPRVVAPHGVPDDVERHQPEVHPVQRSGAGARHRGRQLLVERRLSVVERRRVVAGGHAALGLGDLLAVRRLEDFGAVVVHIEPVEGGDCRLERGQRLAGVGRELVRLRHCMLADGGACRAVVLARAHDRRVVSVAGGPGRLVVAPRGLCRARAEAA